MGTRATTPTTTFQSGKGWYQGLQKFVYTQTVVPVTGAQFASLGFQLPAKSRVVSVHCRNGSGGVTISGGIATAATGPGTAVNAIGLMMFPVSAATVTTPLTAPVANTATQSAPSGTNGTFLAIIPGTGTTESNGIYRGLPFGQSYSTASGANCWNTNQVAAHLAFVPCHTSSQRFAMNNTATDTNTWNSFGTATASAGTSTVSCGSMDVVLYVETFEDYPSMP